MSHNKMSTPSCANCLYFRIGTKGKSKNNIFCFINDAIDIIISIWYETCETPSYTTCPILWHQWRFTSLLLFFIQWIHLPKNNLCAIFIGFSSKLTIFHMVLNFIHKIRWQHGQYTLRKFEIFNRWCIIKILKYFMLSLFWIFFLSFFFDKNIKIMSLIQVGTPLLSTKVYRHCCWCKKCVYNLPIQISNKFSKHLCTQKRN